MIALAKSELSWHAPLGLAVLCAAWLGPLPSLARTAFSPGMITHLAVVALAGPLIGYGLAKSSPRPLPPRGSSSILLFAMLCDMAVVLGWHLTIFHDAAARAWTVFAFEQMTFLATSVAVWYFSFDSDESAPLGAFAMFMIFMHMTILGCVLAISPRLLYDPEVCRGAFGFTPLEDQRFGGILMASWGAVTYLFGALLLLSRMMQRSEAH